MSIRDRVRSATSVLVIMAVTGCSQRSIESDAILPEADPPSRSLRVILSGTRTPENGVWEQVAQICAGNAHMPSSVVRPEPGEPAAKQADLIREVTEPSTILLVEPQDPKAIASALEEVRDKGITVVLLNRAVPVTGKPIPVVEFAPLDSLVKELVRESIRLAEQRGATPSGPAQILIPVGELDERTNACVNALKTQLNEAGVTILPDIPIATTDDLPARFHEMLAAKPRPNLVYGVADYLVKPISIVWGKEQAGNLPVIAGFVRDTANANTANMRACAGVIDLKFRALAQAAVDTAVRIADGESVPERIEIPVDLRLGQRQE